jgi:dimethylhistidine N-methyltransferase
MPPSPGAAVAVPSNLTVVDLAPRVASLREEVVAGLSQPRKALPPKLFYDARGSELFAAICRTSAYYLTRTETAILERYAEEIAAALGRGCAVLEPGAGDARKIRLLLPALRPRLYAGYDISPEPLLSAARDLARNFPWLAVRAVHADYLASGIDALALPPAGRRVLFFPGSSIGNYSRDDAGAFLRRARSVVGPRGAALVGVDLRKPKPILDLAYNDPEGYTARFNLNLLVRINRELGGNFVLDAFRHQSFYDEARGCVEMHLASCRDQEVRLQGTAFSFKDGETIHTEDSHKYAADEFTALARTAGFHESRMWTDPAAWFGVFYLA